MSPAELAPTGIITTTIDCNGVPVDVTTVQNPGESDADFFARHRQRVADAIADCNGGQAVVVKQVSAWTQDGQESTLNFEGLWAEAAWLQLMDTMIANVSG